VHYHTIQIIQPTKCNNFTSLLLGVYVWLNMFRTSPRPSSGAYNCTRSLWFYCWIRSGWSVVGRGLTGYNLQRQAINLWNCCIFLVELFDSYEWNHFMVSHYSKPTCSGRHIAMKPKLLSSRDEVNNTWSYTSTPIGMSCTG